MNSFLHKGTVVMLLQPQHGRSSFHQRWFLFSLIAPAP